MGLLDKIKSAFSTGSSDGQMPVSASFATRDDVVYAPVSGVLVSLKEGNDEVLSAGLLGDGYGIVPGNYNAYVVDNVAAVTSTDANRAAQRVLATDAIPASPAAGAALHAAAQLIATGTSRSALAIFSGRQAFNL